MEKFEKLDNEQKELVKYWIEKYKKEKSFAFIEKHLTPEPVIESGFWWKFEGVEYSKFKKVLIFVTGFDSKNRPLGYGFDLDGKWNNEDSRPWCIDTLIPIKATPEEVEARLIEEAKRRGYKEGVKFISLTNDNIRTISSNKFSSVRSNYLNVSTPKEEWSLNNSISNPHIYKDGKWAEIIDDKSEIRESVARLEAELQELKSKL